jgi:hypothetical protein
MKTRMLASKLEKAAQRKADQAKTKGAKSDDADGECPPEGDTSLRRPAAQAKVKAKAKAKAWMAQLVFSCLFDVCPGSTLQSHPV